MGQFRARELSRKVKIKEKVQVMFNGVIGVWALTKPGLNPGSATLNNGMTQGSLLNLCEPVSGCSLE